ATAMVFKWSASATRSPPLTKICSTTRPTERSVRLSAAPLGARIRDEPLAVRHHDLRQARGVDDLILANDAVHVEYVGDGCVDLRRLEQSWLIERHRPVDVVPERRRIGPVAADRFQRARRSQ